MNGHSTCPGCFQEKDSAEVICSHCGYAAGRDSEPTVSLLPGTRLASRYILGSQLGQGGFGITYLAYDEAEQRRVAIKEYFPDGLVTRTPGERAVRVYSAEVSGSFEAGVDKFQEEARTMSLFKGNPNIIGIYDQFKENGTAYFVMEYVEGQNLKQHLKQVGGTMTVGETLKLLLPVFDALEELHQHGILHRDISPDNIFITSGGVVKLLDFGAARQIAGEKSLSVILKPGFAPEEQYRRKGVQGPWTDIYALGATMYFMLSGQLLPDALDRLIDGDETQRLTGLGVAIGLKVESVIMKAIAPKAENRYQTIRDFKNALILEAIADGSFQLAGPLARTHARRSIRPVKAFGILAIVIVIMAILAATMNGLGNPGSSFGLFRGGQLIRISNEVTGSLTDGSTASTAVGDGATESVTAASTSMTIATTAASASETSASSETTSAATATTLATTIKPTTTAIPVIKYPDSGAYGLNILSSRLKSADMDGHDARVFSVAATLSTGNQLRVVVSMINGECELSLTPTPTRWQASGNEKQREFAASRGAGTYDLSFVLFSPADRMVQQDWFKVSIYENGASTPTTTRTVRYLPPATAYPTVSNPSYTIQLPATVSEVSTLDPATGNVINKARITLDLSKSGYNGTVIQGGNIEMTYKVEKILDNAPATPDIVFLVNVISSSGAVKYTKTVRITGLAAVGQSTTVYKPISALSNILTPGAYTVRFANANYNANSMLP